jgi:hypothetical protein
MQFATRTAAIDLSICPDCGGRLRVIADVTKSRRHSENLNGRRTARGPTTGAAGIQRDHLSANGSLKLRNTFGHDTRQRLARTGPISMSLSMRRVLRPCSARKG